MLRERWVEKVARATGAGIVVTGSYSKSGDSLRMQLSMIDAQTGKELWSSGDQVKTFNHWSGISVSNGRIYLNTFDGTVYCFGIRK